MFSEDSPLPVGGAGAGAGAHDDAAASPPPSPAAVPASASPEKFSTPKSNDRGDERGPNEYTVQVLVEGQMLRLPPFSSLKRASDAYAGILQQQREHTQPPPEASLEAAAAAQRLRAARAAAPAPALSPAPPGGAEQEEAEAPEAAPEATMSPSRDDDAEEEDAEAPAPAPVYKGVYPLANGKFNVQCCIRGKVIYLGHFNSIDEAADAYDTAIRRNGGNVVNKPRRPGEIKAVAGQRKAGGRAAPKKAAKPAKPKPAPPLALPAAPPAPAPAALPALAPAAGEAPAAELNKRKRGRPRKIPQLEAAAAPIAGAAGSAAPQFHGVTPIAGGNGFFSVLTRTDPAGGVMRTLLGSFESAEAAARTHDDEVRRLNPPQLDVLNFPTSAECARMGRQTRATPRRKRAAAEIAAEEEEEAEEADDWQPPPSVRRRLDSPARQPATRRSPRSGSDALNTLAQAASPAAVSPGMASLAAASPAAVSPGAVSPPPLYAAPAPAPAQQLQASPVTPDALTLLAPAPEAPPVPPAPSPLACAVPGDDVIAFLRRIDPPLRGLAAALAAAPGSGLSMRQLRALPKMHSLTAAMMNLQRVAAMLHISDERDKLDLMTALDQLA